MTSSWTAFSVFNLFPLNKISCTIITKAQISFECHDIVQIKIESSSEACHLSLFSCPMGTRQRAGISFAVLITFQQPVNTNTV